MTNRELPKILIIGRPNVGKSTLFNFWVGHRLAIESDIAGTTRDFIAHEVDFGGRRVRLVDTAGFEEVTSDKLLQQAIAITQEQIREADVVLFLVAADDGVQPLDVQIARILQKSGKPLVFAATKADNKKRMEAAQNDFWQLGLGAPLAVSVKQKMNLDKLEERILGEVGEKKEGKKKQPHVVILHGQGSREKPDRRAPQNEDHWLGWLKNELKEKGYQVDNPLIPREWEAGFAEWEKVINKLKITPETILVGHSAGAAFWVRWLIKHQKPIKKLFLVAPAKITHPEQHTTPAHIDLMEFEFENDVKDLIQNGTTIFISDNDLPRRNEATKQYQSALNANVTVLPGRGHFTWPDGVENESFPELLDAILAEEKSEKNHTIRLALLGRPNVGKSSLLNKLLGQERALVSDIAGTTRDLVEMDLEHDGQDFTIVDTAGLRRPGRRKDSLEFYSVDRTHKAIDHSDVVGVVLDAQEGLCKLDLALAQKVMDAGRGLFFVANKWDLLDSDEREFLQNNLPPTVNSMAQAEVIGVSALSGQRVERILTEAEKVASKMRTQIKTSQLNQLFKNEHDILFVSQVGTNPPHFNVQIRGSKMPHFSFKRRVENMIRSQFDLRGVPLKFTWQPKKKWIEVKENLKKV